MCVLVCVSVCVCRQTGSGTQSNMNMVWYVALCERECGMGRPDVYSSPLSLCVCVCVCVCVCAE